jgi:hypothetical protein
LGSLKVTTKERTISADLKKKKKNIVLREEKEKPRW